MYKLTKEDKINSLDAFIIKIQISIATTEETPQVLIYNKNKSLYYQNKADKKILRLMKGAKKKYFYANMIGSKINILEKLLGEAEEQNW